MRTSTTPLQVGRINFLRGKRNLPQNRVGPLQVVTCGSMNGALLWARKFSLTSECRKKTPPLHSCSCLCGLSAFSLCRAPPPGVSSARQISDARELQKYGGEAIYIFKMLGASAPGHPGIKHLLCGNPSQRTAGQTGSRQSMSTCPKRASLKGLGKELLQLVSELACPAQWAYWLRVPLEHAAAIGNLKLVDKLIGPGPSGKQGGVVAVVARSSMQPPLVEAKAWWLRCLRQGAIRMLNVITSAPPHVSALYEAVIYDHTAVAKHLMVAGADVNFEYAEKQRTVLHEATLGGHEQLANDLIMCGADVKARTSNDSTPLHLAVQVGLEGVVSALLLKGADKDAVSGDGNSVLMLACGALNRPNPKVPIVERLLAAGANVNFRGPGDSTALNVASFKGFVPVLQTLLRHGADVNSQSVCGYSGLHAAAMTDKAGAIDALVQAGADIELESNDGRTPLFFAAEFGKAKPLLALLHLGARVGAQDDSDLTAIHLACFFQQEGLEVVVDQLLRWGADETAVDEKGATPADLLDVDQECRTCSQDEIERVRLLLDRSPADRAWSRRGWLAMLRARASRARNDRNDSSGSAGLEGPNVSGGGVDKGRKVARLEGAKGVARGAQGQSSQAVGIVGAGDGGRNEVLRRTVDWLLGVEPAAVFQKVLKFL